MKVLLDTHLFQDLHQPNLDPILKVALRGISAEHIFVSAISMGEITKAISLLQAGKQKTDLQTWFLELEGNYLDRVLPISSEIATIWGEITARAKKFGKALCMSHGLVAATAMTHGLHILTKHPDHFQSTGAMIFNPWDTQ